MIERTCDHCGKTFEDNVTVKDESPAAPKYQPENPGDVPFLCLRCNEVAKGR